MMYTNAISLQTKQLLSKQNITTDSPGTVVHDFDMLIKQIVSEGLEVSKKSQLLPMRVLADINSQLAHPIDVRLKRPLQKSFPHINGLYLLLRVTALGQVIGAGSKTRLAINEQVYASWQTMNMTERYFTLLEAWLLKGHGVIVGEKMGWGTNLSSWITLFEHIPETGLVIAGDKNAETMLSYSPGLFNLALMELFGLISIKHGKAEEGQGWRIKKVQRTPCGEALLALLQSFFDIDHFSMFGQDNISAPFGQLQTLIQAYFSDWKNNLNAPSLHVQQGTHIIKASLGKVWRRIRVPADTTMDDLASCILDAFSFDSSHLYTFKYKNNFGLIEEISDARLDESESNSADDISIGDLALDLGATIDFIYDFGDYWQFTLLLENIEATDNATIQKLSVIDSKGEAPEQYSGWE